MGSETPAQRSGRLLFEAAEIITSWPLVRDRLLAAHVPDGRGRCRSCTSQTHEAPRWPCALAVVAAGHGHPPVIAASSTAARVRQQ